MSEDARQPYDVIVLGGGITGLVAAWKLAEGGCRVALADKSDRHGGVIQTIRDGDWLLDTGPNSLGVREGDDVHQLITSLDLSHEMLVRPVRESDRYIWRRGQLRRVPTSPLHLFRKNAFSRTTITRAAWRMWQRHTVPDQDISVGAYFSACLGRKVVKQALAPAMAGIYAADPFCLSLQTLMPRLYDAARGHTSLCGALRKMRRQSKRTAAPGGRRVMMNFRNGMEALPAAIASRAERAGLVFLETFEADAVIKDPAGGWRVTAKDGRTLNGQILVCALPSTAAAELFDPVARGSAAVLGQISYAPMIMAHIGVREDEVGNSQNGFGFLAVRDAGVRSLGMIWNDRMFPGRAPDGHRLFTVFLGGQVDPSAMDFTDDQLLEIIRHDLLVAMNWTGRSFAYHRISRMPAAIPLMEVGHAQRVEAARNQLPPGIVITGNYVAGVSVPACMRAGVDIANDLERRK